MTAENTAQAVTDPASSGDADVDAISTTDPRSNGQDANTNGAGGDLEARARRMGWMPEEKYRGPKHNWLPADAFIEKIEAEAPIRNERLRTQDEIIRKQQSKIDEIEKLSKEQSEMLRELVSKTSSAEERGYARMRKDLEDRRTAAVSEADTDGFNRIQRELDDLEKAKPATKKASEDGGDNKTTTKPDKPQPGPEVQQWMTENRWFNPNDPDDDVSIYAIQQDAKIGRKSAHLSVSERLDKVKEAVEKRFPEQFENASRRAPPAVSGPSGHVNGKGKKGKSFADLDEHAKTAFQKIKARTPGYTVEEYLKAYR